jgi:hypothetical protein
MNANTTSRGRRHANRAAALTFAALLFGAAACGTETASDGGLQAAPAAAPYAQSAPHAPTSADAAERQGAAEQRAARAAQDRYLRHLRMYSQKRHELKLLKLRRSHMASPAGRDLAAS